MANNTRSDNAFERDMPGTNARTAAEAAIEELRLRGGVFVNAVRATRMPMLLTDPTLPGNPIVFANDSFLKLSGYSMEEVLGQQPHFMNGSGTDPKDAPRFQEMLRSEQDEILETVQYRKDGSPFVATVLLSAFKDDHGNTLNHFMSWLDVTRRIDAEAEVLALKNAQAALRASEERHAFLLELGDAIRGANVAEAKIEIAAQRLGERLNASRVLWAEYDWERNLALIFNGWFADGAQPSPTVMQLADYEGEVLNQLKAGTTVRVDNIGLLTEEPGYAAIAEVGVQALVSRPLLEGGKLKVNLSVHQREPRHWSDDEVALVEEVSERLWAEVVRTRTEAALIENEQRYRLIVENARYASIFTTDPDGMVDDWHEGAATIFGYSKEEIVGEDSRILFTVEDREAGEPEKELRTAAETGKADNVRWHLRKDGSLVFIEGVSTALRDAKGVLIGFLKVGLDATERRRAQEHEQTLLGELQHRVRNTLAVIRSIVRRTAQTAESVEQFEQNLDGRLSSFARTQAYVTRDPQGSIDLELLVRDELLAHAAGGNHTITIKGEPIRLGAKQAESVGLAIHELTSNAIRYGALTSDGNRIDVSWSVDPHGKERMLKFQWFEHLRDRDLGQPGRSGFGTELLERVLAYELDAETKLEFRPDGFCYQADIPLSNRG